MFSSLYFQMASSFYILLLTFVFFRKQRLKSLENKLYAYLIITNIVGLILDLVSTDLAIINVNSIFLNPICKIYLVYLITWLFIFTYYIIVISIKKETLEAQELFNKKSKNILIVIYIIFSLVILIIPLYNFSENGIIYTYGPCANFAYIVAGLNLVVWLYFLFTNFKTVRKEKYLPVFAFIILMAFVVIIQKTHPELLLVTSIACFVTFLMYFTIENPDMKLINELNIARTQAELANNSKSEFLSNMSHEIRTPLNAIVGFSQSLYEKHSDEEIREDVEDILMASESLIEIVNGILDISKIEANKLEIINSEYNLSKVLDEVVALAKGRLGDKALEFKISFDQDMPPVLYGDYTRLKQILINILTNAIKYTPKGYIEFKVSCVTKSSYCQLIMSIEDTGIGIKKENIDKLFTKFTRMDHEKNISIEGTGLGLAITKRLVELMGGQIVVQSVYGKGSRFTVAITQRVVLGTTEIEEIKEDTIEELDFSGKRVLVVDDNKLNLKVALRLISNYKVQIDELESGQECLDKIASGEKYDLILIDDMMPNLTGVDTLHKLREMPDYNTPTVVLTANAISGMREKYLSIGFNDYLSKPIERKELSRVIKKYLSK